MQTLSQNSFVYFDEYFTKVLLLQKLCILRIDGSGTIPAKRLKELELTNSIIVDRGESFDHVSNDGMLVAVG